jgi:hypothetical protein
VGVAALCAAVAGCGFVGTSGVSVRTPAGDAAPEVSRDDVAALDEYADELGLVMARSRDADPEAYARQVDGPGPDVATLVADTTDGGGADIVLRIRTERQDCDWTGHCVQYEIEGCYRWLFDDRMDEHEPERLGACPDAAVIELGPAPVEPRLPDGLVDRLRRTLSFGRDPAEQVVLDAARVTYRAAVAAAVDDGVDRSHLLGVDQALGPDSVATVGESVGVAVGVGTECAMVRASPDGVEVWVPERVSLQPGEVGCDASGQLAQLEY